MVRLAVKLEFLAITTGLNDSRMYVYECNLVHSD